VPAARPRLGGPELFEARRQVRRPNKDASMQGKTCDGSREQNSIPADSKENKSGNPGKDFLLDIVPYITFHNIINHDTVKNVETLIRNFEYIV
jgi:hypothetical protein